MTTIGKIPDETTQDGLPRSHVARRRYARAQSVGYGVLCKKEEVGPVRAGVIVKSALAVVPPGREVAESGAQLAQACAENDPTAKQPRRNQVAHFDQNTRASKLVLQYRASASARRSLCSRLYDLVSSPLRGL